jgi:PAS domain S-box-containing protein
MGLLRPIQYKGGPPMPWTFNNLLLVAFIAVVGFVLGAVYAWRQTAAAAAKQTAILHQDHEWFRTTLANISDGVIASNADGKVTFLNAVAQTLTGWMQEEARGKPLAEVFKIIDDKTRQTAESHTVVALREGAAVGLAKHTLVAKDGAEKRVENCAAPVRDESGTVIGVVLVLRASIGP